MQPHRQASRESAHAAAAADRADPTEVNETKEKREAARQCKDGRRRRKPPPNPNPRRKSRATLLPRPRPRPYTCKKSVLNESASPRCPPPIFLVVHAIGDWLIRPLDVVAGVPTLSLSRSRSRSSVESTPPLTRLKLPSRCDCECACEYGVVVRSRSRIVIRVEASCGLFADGPEVDEGGYAPFMLGLLCGPAGLTEEWP